MFELNMSSVKLSFNDLSYVNGLKPDNETYLCGESYWTGVEHEVAGCIFKDMTLAAQNTVIKGIAFVTDNNSLRIKANQNADYPDSLGCNIWRKENIGNYVYPVCTNRGHLNLSHNDNSGSDGTIDPHLGSHFNTYTNLAYETLLAKDANFKNIPGLATSWESNYNSTEWLFKLREGVLFHDGSEMDSDDVAYSLLRIVDPNIDSNIKSVFANIQDVEKISKYEINIILDSSNVDFPELLTDHQAAIIRDNAASTINEDGIGTGPFMRKSKDFSGLTEVLSHDGYWGGLPGVRSINIRAMSEWNDQVQAMLNADIDFINIGNSNTTQFDNT